MDPVSAAPYPLNWWETYFPQNTSVSDDIRYKVRNLLDPTQEDYKAVSISNASPGSFTDQQLTKIASVTRTINECANESRSRAIAIDFFENLQLAIRVFDEWENEHNLNAVVRLTCHIYRTVFDLKSRVQVEIDFFESFRIAVIVSGNRGDKGIYYDKKVHSLNVDILRPSDQESFVMLPREHGNFLGKGHYKIAFLALRVFNSTDVIPVVQYVSTSANTKFKQYVTDGLSLLSDVGCLKCYGIFRRLRAKGCDVDEIAFSEYWEGGDLIHYTQWFSQAQSRRLTLDEQIKIAKDLAMMLHKLHLQQEHKNEKGPFLHGDMKLGNCFIRGRGEDIAACIGDGDLARSVHKKEISTRLSMYAGSLPYTPPEVLKNVFTNDGGGQKADVYALGLILHELVIGTPSWFELLFSHEERFRPIVVDLEQTVDEKIKQDPKRKDEFNGRFIDSLKTILNMSKDRKEIIKRQEAIELKIKELEKIVNPTRQQRFHLFIYRLLHPDPTQRAELDDQALQEL